MAEVRNTFIKSKMNKDLDARILPAGEYRDAVNVTVSTSEGADVGALENILGNKLLPNFGISTTDIGVELIGLREEPGKNRIFGFFTNYVDASDDNLSNPASKDSHCSIVVYDITTGTQISLVAGSFLNFSKTHPIFGINIIEDLLFWTDNRNQPRQINIESAIVNPSNNINPYYTIEENISVAKYYPFESPKIYSEETITVSVVTTTTVWGSTVTPDNYPQMLFESECTIISGTPKMKLHPGLKFELISTVEDPNYPDPVNPELTYPYQNEIKNYLYQPLPFIGGTTSVIGFSQPLWKADDANPNDQPVYNPPNPLKFKSNIPFHYLDVNGDPAQWQGTATLKMVEQEAVSVTEKWLKPTFRATFQDYDETAGDDPDFLQSQGLLGVSQQHQLPRPFMWPGSAAPTDPDAAAYQESIGAYLVMISVNESNAYGVGNDFGNLSNTEYYYRRWFCNYIQPGMKVSWPAMNEDDDDYIVDQIFGTNSGGGFTNEYMALSIRKIDKKGNPVKEWQWPVFVVSGTTGGTVVPLLSFSFKNPYYEEEFGGNETFFKEKFCRLAYRFIYDSNETSLISPFTQSLFKPKQEGFYLYSDNYAGFKKGDTTFVTSGSPPNSDITNVGISTSNFLYENSVNRVNINIPMPVVNNNQLTVGEISSVLKIKQIDIIYEDSASTNLLILKSISADDLSIVGNTDTSYIYKWEGDKPFKTLPSSEAARTSDVVPIRALGQEVSGNRIIYGNFVNRHTSPEFLDYSVGISRKYNIQQKFTEKTGIEYPNHTLKQNRIYQVGVVLSDKYGRQSDVILAPPVFSTDVTDNSIFSGDTFYSSYFKRNEVSGVVSSSSSNIVNWIGNSLKMLWTSTIPKSIPGLQGYPGLYTLLGGINNLDIDSSDVDAGYITSKNVATTTNSIGSGLTVDIIATPITAGPPISGGQITSVNINNPGIGYEIGDIVDVSGGTILTRLTIVGVNEANDLGWYSFKVVVKQQQQQYYNIYMPTMINGEPLLPGDPPGSSTEALNGIAPGTNSLTSFSLIGDNINKIPTVVTESNSQISYSSSEVKLYPRISQFGDLYYSGNGDTSPVGTGWLPADTDICTGVVDLGNNYDSVIYVGNINELYNEESRIAVNANSSVTTTSLVETVYTTAIFKQADNPYSVVSENGLGRSPFIYFDVNSLRKPIGSGSGAAIPYAGVSDFFGYPVNTGMGINLYHSQINYSAGFFDGSYLSPNNLSVIEVEAFESDLDIFWETSTAGLVSELNYLIENNSDEGITSILLRQDNDFTESSPTTLFEGYWLAQSTPIPVNNLVPTASIDPYIISLKPINALNQQVPLSRIASVVMTVMDNNGTDVSSQFLISNDANASVSIYKIYLVNNPQTFLQDSAIRNFTCSITITSTPAFVGGDPVISNFTETLTLQNEIPVLVNAGSNTGITPIVTGVGGTFWGDDGTTATANAQSPSYRNGAYVNADAGTVDGYLSRGFSIETTKEIVWSFVSCIETTSGVDIVSTLSLGEGSSGKVVDLNAGVVGAIQMYVNKNYFVADATAGLGTYELIYRITDASGDGSVYEYPTTGSLASLIFSIA
tara:strand:+ start:4508 stop:9223 length:4716 start_codon:yes stop_codon:yes gene_type:complete